MLKIENGQNHVSLNFNTDKDSCSVLGEAAEGWSEVPTHNKRAIKATAIAKLQNTQGKPKEEKISGILKLATADPKLPIPAIPKIKPCC